MIILKLLRIKPHFVDALIFLRLFLATTFAVVALVLLLLMKPIEMAKTKDNRRALFLSSSAPEGPQLSVAILQIIINPSPVSDIQLIVFKFLYNKLSV
jgi:hypothetical protein